MALDMNVWEHAAEAALPPDLTAQLSKKNYFPQNASEDLRLITSHETNGKADLRRGLALLRKFSLSIPLLQLSIQNKYNYKNWFQAVSSKIGKYLKSWDFFKNTIIYRYQDILYT